MKNGVVENINDLKQGEALENKINELAKGYNSFMDNDLNINSSVQFIMQTQEIKAEDAILSINEDNLSNTQNQSLWQKIIDFFRR